MAESISILDSNGVSQTLTVADILSRSMFIEGRSRRRCLTEDDAQAFIDLCAENPDKRVRVYASDGFVANSYGHSQITYVERLSRPFTSDIRVPYVPASEMYERVIVTRGEANRKYGRGSLRIISQTPMRPR